jgi:hypothetical protein
VHGLHGLHGASFENRGRPVQRLGLRRGSSATILH